MKTKTPRTWVLGLIVTLVAVAFISITGWLLASPADQITQAVSASGAKDISHANSDAFLSAFSSALVQADPAQTTAYVTAAKKLRPDLNDQIVTTAAEVNTGETKGGRPTPCPSQNKKKCTICHKGRKTLTLPCKAAEKHLEHHPDDTRGPCPP